MSVIKVRPEWVTRWVATGASDGEAGAAGVPRLAATAVADMDAGGWAKSEEPGAIPPHIFDRERPTGDAFKAVYGYDKTAYTERSCCGAACYVVKLPADEMSVTAVSVRVLGDRYLAAGAWLFAFFTGSAEPIDVPSRIGNTVGGNWLKVCVAENSGNVDIVPNYRADTDETASIQILGSTTSASYLHLYIKCADYLSTRGAWVEGGATILPGTIELTTNDVYSLTPYEFVLGSTAEQARTVVGDDPNSSRPVSIDLYNAYEDESCLMWHVYLPPTHNDAPGLLSQVGRLQDQVHVASAYDPTSPGAISEISPLPDTYGAAFDVASCVDPIRQLNEDCEATPERGIVGQVPLKHIENLPDLPLGPYYKNVGVFVLSRIAKSATYDRLSVDITKRAEGVQVRAVLYRGTQWPWQSVTEVGGFTFVEGPAHTKAAAGYKPSTRELAKVIDPAYFPYDAGEGCVAGRSVCFLPVGSRATMTLPPTQTLPPSTGPTSRLTIALTPIGAWNLTVDGMEEGNESLSVSFASPMSFAEGDTVALFLYPCKTLSQLGGQDYFYELFTGARLN